jgi:hypothetical protein
MTDQENINAAAAAPMAMLRNLLGGMPTEPCGHRFAAPEGPCGGGGQHVCTMTVPHIAHVCGCGASDHQHF